MSWTQRLWTFLVGRWYGVVVFAALFCTLAVKLYHATRTGLLNRYPSWTFSDISVLAGVEFILAAICFLRPTKRVFRAVTIVAVVVCWWAVMNAAWLIRTGTQILPSEMLPAIRDPVDVARMVAVNMVKAPISSAALVVPGMAVLALTARILMRPPLLARNTKRFFLHTGVSVVVVLGAVAADARVGRIGSLPPASVAARFNCHSRAILGLFLPQYRHLVRQDFVTAKRTIPTVDQIALSFKSGPINHNVVIVVLEGVQYNYTSLAGPGTLRAEQARLSPWSNDPTPNLRALAQQGVWFTNMRSTITHTTKALFALLMGRFPAASQDVGEAVPVEKPYASLATILRDSMGFRTAFFQSALGSFESRPGLVYNLGFETFRTREDLHDPSCYVGYLGADEFAMLTPIVEWIKAGDRPFLLTFMCSVTHDPYEVPHWFGEPRKAVEGYMQTIAYTDQFIAALDVELAKLGLTDETIFCVVGDHGEAFGEHGVQGHERITYEELLRVPLYIRAPGIVKAGLRVDAPVSSVDLTPTLLSLLGFDVGSAGFDGAPVLPTPPTDRKVYFCGWMQQGPAGFVQGGDKYVVDPTDNTVSLYGVGADPCESSRVELTGHRGRTVAEDVIRWKKGTIFRIGQPAGQKVVFDHWVLRWNNRVCSAKRKD